MRSPSQQTPAGRGLFAWECCRTPFGVAGRQTRAGTPARTLLRLQLSLRLPYTFLTDAAPLPVSADKFGITGADSRHEEQNCDCNSCVLARPILRGDSVRRVRAFTQERNSESSAQTAHVELRR